MAKLKVLAFIVCFILSGGCQATVRNDCQWLAQGEISLNEGAIDKCIEQINLLSEERKNKLVSWAISTSDASVVDYLVSRANIDLLKLNESAVIDYSFLALDTLGDPLGMLVYLESKGIDFNQAELGGHNIVYYAIEIGNLDVFKYFLGKEAYKSLVVEDSNILAAAALGNKNVIDKLLALGLDPKFKDKKGQDSVFYAEARGHVELARYLQNEIETN